MVLQKYNTGHMTAGASLRNFKLWVQLFTFPFDMWLGAKPTHHFFFKKLSAIWWSKKSLGVILPTAPTLTTLLYDNSSYRILKAKYSKFSQILDWIYSLGFLKLWFTFTRQMRIWKFVFESQQGAHLSSNQLLFKYFEWDFGEWLLSLFEKAWPAKLHNIMNADRYTSLIHSIQYK